MGIFQSWNSIESVTRIHSYADIAGVVILGLLVIAETISQIYGHQETKLKFEQQIIEQQIVKNLKDKAEQTAKQLAPRVLSDEQKDALITNLSQYRGQKININFVAENDESSHLAHQFSEMFVQANWNVNLSGIMGNGLVPSGIIIASNKADIEANRILKSFVALRKTLVDQNLIMGTSSEAVKDPHCPSGTIVMTVGVKY